MLRIDRARPMGTLLVVIGITVLGGQRAPAQSRGPGGPQIPATALVQARTSGKTRVIVGMDVSFTPEAALATATAVLNQRTSISRAQSAVLARMLRVNPSSIRRFSYIPFLAMEVDEGDLQTLATLPEVKDIEIDAVARPTLAESTQLVGATRAWAAGYTGNGWTVAVLDTGIDKTHPFLNGKVISEACYSTMSSESTSVCPDGTSSRPRSDPGSRAQWPNAGMVRMSRELQPARGPAFQVSHETPRFSPSRFSAPFSPAPVAPLLRLVR